MQDPEAAITREMARRQEVRMEALRGQELLDFEFGVGLGGERGAGEDAAEGWVRAPEDHEDRLMAVLAEVG